MKKTISEQELLTQVEHLPTEITPERDLWSGIEKAIHNQPAVPSSSVKRVYGPTAWAASIVAAVLLTWGVYSPTPQTLQKSDNLVAVMQQDFEQQKQTMLVSFGQPDIKAFPSAMQTELTKLTSAQHTIKQALENDPNNVDLLNLLRWTQQQELDLLKQLYSPQWQTI